jgi:outer membrane receptor protein involved in Fe transport
VALMNNNEGLWRFTSSADSTLRLYSDPQQQLRLLATGGVDRFQQENDLLFPPELLWQQTSPLHGASGYASSTGLNLNFGLNLVHDWRPASGLYVTNTSAGFQYESTDLRTYRLFTQNLNAGQSNIDAGTQTAISENRERVHDRGAYLQEEVLLLERKLALSAGLRGETSSSNGDPNKIFFYPKASASYRFQRPVNSLDDLKVRAAYGETGNHPLYGARFTSLQVNNNLGGNPGTGVNFNCSPAAPGNGACAGDPNIKPERAREIEVGTDVSAWEGAATLELNLYQRTIVDLLLQHAVPASSGWTAQWSNGGVIRNRGIELALTVTPKLGNDLRLQSTLTFARNVSEVRSLPGGAFVTGGFGALLGVYRIEQGASVTQIVGDAGPNPDGSCCVIKKLGDAEPDFMVHFSSRLGWRNFTLSFLLDWQYGSSVINLTRLLYDLAANSNDWDTTGQARFNRWVNQGKGFYADAYVENASFLKMREITISYDVPAESISRLWSVAKRLRISISARNLFTITPYSSWDPEVSNFANQPVYRNIEVTPYPPSRSFWTSIDLGFY